MARVVVLGAGVVGLSTAVQLQDALPQGAPPLTLIAERFHTDTTSDGAAGIFRPTVSKTPGVPVPLLRQWLRDSWTHYDRLAHSPLAAEAGVQILSGYQFAESPEENELEKELLYHWRPLTDKELHMFPDQTCPHGFFVTTLMTEGRRYLPFLMKRFKENGGIVRQEKITKLEQLAGNFDIVVNCLGFGSKELLNDDKLVPIRGHLLRVKAPWMKHLFVIGEHGTTLIYPGRDNVVIGGTRDRGEVDLHPRPEDREKMWRDACRVVPSLEKAELLWEWVGLRPFRNPLRLEKETFNFPAGSLKVVHNYGHGAEGVSLSWGTATHAVRLVKELLQEGTPSKAKL